ncbi:acyltransferase [Flavobacterium sp. NRK1]|uniref:acyltransferase family protein n=1 Tax=Flavobacterium sp. NRK1 TaxID=2954929 RepID=UPI002092D27E|nr:acyltransferase [Flavobacterium sp. NRK1]MCO6146585.1 acyltransferase [Flavobacterium sp. NRK1]
MRLEQLTFTRFIAAIAIVVFHFGSGAYPFNNEKIGFIIHQANVGVSYFYILSGFIMVVAYSSLEKINTLSFLRNRFARIYPLLFLSVVILFLQTYFFDPNFSFGIIKDAIINLSLLQAWIPSKALIFNGPAWSLSVEVFFYLIFPFLFNKFFFRRKLWVVTIVVIVFWIISQMTLYYLSNSSFNKGYPSPSHAFIFFFPVMHLSAFLMGNLGGVFFIKKLAGKSGRYDIAVVLSIIFFILFLKHHPFGLNYHNGLLAVIFVPFIIFMCINRGIVTRVLNTRFFIVLGEISFGIYILQLPVFRLTTSIVRQLNITHDPQNLFYISFAVLIILSTLSYYYFETPVRNIIKTIKIKSFRV